MVNTTGKQKKGESSQKVSDFFANVLMVFAIFSAFVAMLFACFWFITSWYTPYENYKESIFVADKKGYSFRIEYPKRILANGRQVTLTITLRGEIDAAKTIDIELPNEVRPSGIQDSIEILGDFYPLKFQDSAANRIVQAKFILVNSKLPQTVKLIFTHSKTVKGILLYKNKLVTIKSKDLLSEPIPITFQMETTSWAVIREFVNSSVGDKSPLILLISGLISGAGSYLLQFIKEKREQYKDNQQEKRERKELAKKNNDELWSGLKSNPVQTIKNFADQVREESTIDPITLVVGKLHSEFRVLKLNDWQNLLFKQVLVYWYSEDIEGASQIIEELMFLEKGFLGQTRENTIALLEINKLLSSENNILQLKDAEAILNAHEYWGNPCKPILQNMLVKYMQTPGNLSVIAKVFEGRKKFGYLILRAPKINALLGHYDTSQLAEEQKEALEDLNSFIWSGINWRPLWQSFSSLPSHRIYQWLKYNEADTKHVPFGSEFAELDVDLDYYKIEHPIISQVGHPMSTIVFGEVGSGKTATAFILIKNCRTSNISITGLETGVFPIYCRFDDSIDVRTWLVETVSEALIDFVSANPDRFLVADSSRKLAMGRLMQIKATTVDKLRSSLGKAGIAASEDIDEITKQLAGVETPKYGEKIRDIDVVSLLRMAIPDGFNKVYYLMDISNRFSLERASIAIRDIADLSLQLAAENFFFKIFAPLEIKPDLGDISMFEQLTLTWDDEQLKRLSERRFERFRIFCDRKIKEPNESLIKASKRSPRKLIHYGNSLMQYVEANLRESEKLPIEAFFKLLRTNSKDKNI